MEENGFIRVARRGTVGTAVFDALRAAMEEEKDHVEYRRIDQTEYQWTPMQ